MEKHIHKVAMAAGIYMAGVGVYVCTTIVETAPQGFLGLSMTVAGVIAFVGAAIAATE